ncbi:MAG: IS5/IS1182 family transposase, partial [Clostridia bacterium]|nr:IS5/IS1182 family transposase [Clostridia bacterium]
KRCFGMGLIRTKLDITTRSSIALSILAMNLSRLAKDLLRVIFYPIFLIGLWNDERFKIA